MSLTPGNPQSRFLLRLEAVMNGSLNSTRKVDIRLPEKGSSNSHGARPVYQNDIDDLVDSDQ